jgi:ATP-dependent helicase/nuclease subunit A
MGVPARFDCERSAGPDREQRDLESMLAAVADPTDEVAVVAALRSACFGCDDAALGAHVGAGGRWDYRAQEDGPGADAVRRAFATLRSLHEQAGAGVEAASDTVSRLVGERRPRPSVAAGDGADAVRVLTIHGAKGLEFPVVLLGGLSAVERHRPPAVLFGPLGPEMRLAPGVESKGYRDASDDDREAEAAERLRLFYVGATRARDHLVVSLHHRAGDDCTAARVTAVGADRHEGSTDQGVGSGRAEVAVTSAAGARRTA